MSKADTNLKEKKAAFFARMKDYLAAYQKVIIVHADNVGSKQMQQVRKSLRGQAVMLMGKNTMMRKVIRQQIKENPALEKLLPTVTGNVGLIFTNGDPAAIRNVVDQHKVGAPARAGTNAPSDVFVPPGPTGMEPTQTGFFQALNIATKIVKGQIEIVNEVKLITKGNKVGNSEAVLLQKLSIKPFAYGLVIQHVYDNGAVYGAEVLDLTDDDVLKQFTLGLANVKAISVALSAPSIVAVPFALSSAYAKVLAVSLEANITFKGNEAIKAYLANPSAFASAAPAAAASSSGGGAPAKAAAAAAPAKKEEKEEEEDGDMGLGLFD